MSGTSNLRKADLYSPRDLLRNAKYLLDTRDPKALRAVVLESMTALEVYVHTKVFKFLEEQLDIEFIEWLKKKTRFDFRSRLGAITPLALGLKISIVKGSTLWNRYTEAKKIRNEVSHEGRIISFDEGQKVYNTVFDWLACLGSSIGMELALIKLKQHIEENHLSISTEFEVADILNSYFRESSVATPITQEVYLGRSIFDFVLQFGTKIVALEMKLLMRLPTDLNQYIADLIPILSNNLEISNFSKIALIIFLKGEVPISFQQIKKYQAGSILVSVIKIE